ncbi:AIDA repeat-containing protein [Escherichia coli]
MEQGAANNILLANGGVLTVESDTSSDKTPSIRADGRSSKQKPLRQARRSPAVNKLSRVWRMEQLSERRNTNSFS